MPKQPVLFAIGHSNRQVRDLLDMLQAHGVKCLVDIRTFPRSRHNPQFNEGNLRVMLRKRGIGYVHLGELGGLRKARKDSVNTGWRNASFRGFADYMQTGEFVAGLKRLTQLAGKRTVAMMCAEGNPFRCHRSLVADALSIRGAKVYHITSRSGSREHVITGFARVKGRKITYPGG
ncbi:DUF488 domain-containing protein [Candidatus Woesearchaeota archaeon]|nr:MAG: DUF488 domain-containing protein [Candidatus Woesearchaeota archaeon]